MGLGLGLELGLGLGFGLGLGLEIGSSAAWRALRRTRSRRGTMEPPRCHAGVASIGAAAVSQLPPRT